MSLGLFNEFMFDSIVFKPTGVALTHCSCQGKHDYFIPRSHIDFVTCGRRMYVKTFIVGMSLLIAGIALLLQQQANTTAYGVQPTSIAVYLYVPGIILMVTALMGMIPTTLMLSTNYATFTSSKCTNDFAGFQQWIETGDQTKDVDAAAKQHYANQQQQYEQQYAPQQLSVIPPSSPSHQQQQQWASPHQQHSPMHEGGGNMSVAPMQMQQLHMNPMTDLSMAQSGGMPVQQMHMHNHNQNQYGEQQY